jgi:hypothetical protein
MIFISQRRKDAKFSYISLGFAPEIVRITRLLLKREFYQRLKLSIFEEKLFSLREF